VLAVLGARCGGLNGGGARRRRAAEWGARGAERSVPQRVTARGGRCSLWWAELGARLRQCSWL